MGRKSYLGGHTLVRTGNKTSTIAPSPNLRNIQVCDDAIRKTAFEYLEVEELLRSQSLELTDEAKQQIYKELAVLVARHKHDLIKALDMRLCTMLLNSGMTCANGSGLMNARKVIAGFRKTSVHEWDGFVRKDLLESARFWSERIKKKFAQLKLEGRHEAATNLLRARDTYLEAKLKARYEKFWGTE